jgi:hypothetical protein
METISFRVKMGGPETTDEIVAHLKANGFACVDERINQKNFPLIPKEVQDEDEIVIYDPEAGFTEKEGLAILNREGLIRPTYEHALRFAWKHGTATISAEKPLVIFLHKPWQGADRFGLGRILYVKLNPSDRKLRVNSPGLRFNDYCVLAGVNPGR